MNILAIAYACEPDRGSEPGVGWNWVKLIADHKEHNITVLTRANNKPVIDKYMMSHNDMKADFIYYDLPKWILKYKHGDRGIKLFYSLWQIGVIKHIKKNVDISQYDLIWDFNFGSLNLPLFTYKLKKKYVIGPVSTKKKMPEAYIKKMSLKGRMKYAIQQFMKEHLWSNPIVWKALKKADRVILCNEMSKEFLPKCQREKAQVVFHNGIVEEDYPKYQGKSEHGDKLELIYAGRLIDTKNIETAINALKIVKDSGRDFSFDIYGNGNLKEKLEKQVTNLGLEKNITFHKKVSQQELFAEYIKKDCFLFPSLLEISSTAVMEAMFCGLLPVSMDIRCMEFIYNGSPAIRVPCIAPEVDAKEIAHKILSLETAEIKKLKDECYDFAKNNFIWETRRNEITTLLNKLS